MFKCIFCLLYSTKIVRFVLTWGSWVRTQALTYIFCSLLIRFDSNLYGRCVWAQSIHFCFCAKLFHYFILLFLINFLRLCWHTCCRLEGNVLYNNAYGIGSVQWSFLTIFVSFILLFMFFITFLVCWLNTLLCMIFVFAVTWPLPYILSFFISYLQRINDAFEIEQNIVIIYGYV